MYSYNFLFIDDKKYYENGVLQMDCNYKDDIKDGPYKEYDKNCNIIIDCNYIDGGKDTENNDEEEVEEDETNEIKKVDFYFIYYLSSIIIRYHKNTMDKYNIITNFMTHKLDDQPIPSIYNDIKEDVKKQLENFETEFKEKCLKLQEETMNKLISGELEYKIDPHQYVENYPIVHLKVDDVLKGQKCNISNFTIRDINIHGNSHYILNYPDSKFYKLNNTEYIIYVIFKTDYEDINSYHKKKYMIYITNFGRYIKSTFYKPQSDREPSSFCMLRNSQLVNYSHVGGNYNTQVSQHNLVLTDYTPLEYRMPRLFLKILEAYNKEDTDLLQECCKDYFIKHMESKQKDDEIERLKKEIKELKKFYMES